MHLVHNRSTRRLFYFLLLHCADETQSGQNSYSRLHMIHGFQFGHQNSNGRLNIQYLTSACISKGVITV